MPRSSKNGQRDEKLFNMARRMVGTIGRDVSLFRTLHTLAFEGSEAVAYLQQNNYVGSEEEALFYANQMLQKGLIVGVGHDGPFLNSKSLFKWKTKKRHRKFRRPPSAGPPLMSQESLAIQEVHSRLSQRQAQVDNLAKAIERMREEAEDLASEEAVTAKLRAIKEKNSKTDSALSKTQKLYQTHYKTRVQSATEKLREMKSLAREHKKDLLAAEEDIKRAQYQTRRELEEVRGLHELFQSHSRRIMSLYDSIQTDNVSASRVLRSYASSALLKLLYLVMVVLVFVYVVLTSSVKFVANQNVVVRASAALGFLVLVGWIVTEVLDDDEPP